VNFEELQAWILSADGLAQELSLLARYAAAKSIGGLSSTDEALREHKPDWRRFLFAGSTLSMSQAPRASEFALTVAQAGLLYSGSQGIADASATVLTQLANHRAVQLALDREHLREGFERRLGASEQMLLARRELQQSVFPAKGAAIVANRFQREFWGELERTSWVSASAPTASGKTYGF
jgi:hypothetical protein